MDSNETLNDLPQHDLDNSPHIGTLRVCARTCVVQHLIAPLQTSPEFNPNLATKHMSQMTKFFPKDMWVF